MSSSSPKDKLRLTAKNVKPSPPELVTFESPYSLRKTKQLRYKNQVWTVGDIVSLIDEEESTKTFYAQVIELYENGFCIKKAKIVWLVPKANIGVPVEKKIHLGTFKPEDYKHLSVTYDQRLFPMSGLTFVMRVPDRFEYKQLIGTDYLIDTPFLSHAERYADSDEDDGPKSKSKVRRLLNK